MGIGKIKPKIKRITEALSRFADQFITIENY